MCPSTVRHPSASVGHPGGSSDFSVDTGIRCRYSTVTMPEYSDLARLSRRARAVEEAHGEAIGKLLARLYYQEGKTLQQISEELAVPLSTLGEWMVRLGLNARSLAAKKAGELAG